MRNGVIPYAALILIAALFFGPLAGSTEEDISRIASLFESSFAQETVGNVDRALRDVLTVLQVKPAHYIAHYRAAWLYYLKGKYADSTRHYDQAVALAPGAIEPRLGLMLPLMAAQRWGEAESLGEQIYREAPGNYLAGSRLAFVYFSQGKYEPAERLYRAVLKNYPSEIEMMLGLSWTYLRQGRKEEARTLFEEVLAIRPGNSSARTGLDGL